MEKPIINDRCKKIRIFVLLWCEALNEAGLTRIELPQPFQKSRSIANSVIMLLKPSNYNYVLETHMPSLDVFFYSVT
jgi:hypothetical protein